MFDSWLLISQEEIIQKQEQEILKDCLHTYLLPPPSHTSTIVMGEIICGKKN